MTDFGTGNGNQIAPRDGRVPARNPGTVRAPAGFQGPGESARPARPSAIGPDGLTANLGAAFQRLRALLAMDGDTGPRDAGVRRGYYLNILV